MPRLARRDFVGCLEFLRGIYAARNLDQFAAQVLATVSGVVPAALVAYNEYNPARNRNRYTVDRPDGEPPEGEAVFNAFIHEHPLVHYNRRHGFGRIVKISDFVTSAQYHRLGLYNEFFRRCDPPVEDLMNLCFLARGPRVLAVALCRPRRSFGERERFVLELLRGHLKQAYLNAEALEVEGLVTRALGELRQGVIVLGANLRVRWASSAVPGLLAAHFGAPGRGEGRLPEGLLRWVRQEVAALDGKETIPSPRSPLVIEQADRRLLVRLVRQTEGCVIFLREQSTSIDPQLLGPLGLTPREREVLAWVARGKSDAEIAALAGMSRRTVEKHLERIYTKLGVENRTAAAGRALEFLSSFR